MTLESQFTIVLKAFKSFIKNWVRPCLFCLFSFFSHDKYSKNLTSNSVDGVLGTQIPGGRMVGADKSTELWQQPTIAFIS